MLCHDKYFVVIVKLNFVRDRLTLLMMKIKFNLLPILTMNSLNVKHHKEIAPINWHFTYQLTQIYENFKE